MNEERLKALATRLRETQEANFNLGCWLVERHCGTVACIAGHAALLAGGVLEDGDNGLVVMTQLEERAGVKMTVHDAATEWLGLTSQQADALFIPHYDSCMEASPAQAASVVEELIATGLVRWYPVHVQILEAQERAAEDGPGWLP